MSVPRDFQTLSSSPEELSDRLSGNFTYLGVPKGDRLEALTVEIHLTPQEAAWGITLPFGIPVGPAYRFAVYHLMPLAEPCEIFPMTIEVVK